MFSIRYRIPLEVIDELKILTATEFDKDYTDIDGQIKILFSDKCYGFYDEEYDSSDELLMWWFSLLNKVAKTLGKSNYVAMRIPETYDSYFVFRKHKNTLLVSFERSTNTLNKSLVIQKPLGKVYQHIWAVEIKYDEFKNSVYNAIKSFINSVDSINNEILESVIFKSFMSEINYK